MRHRLREDERSLLAASSITVTLGAATLIVTYFSAEVAAYVTRYAGHEDIRITEQESRLANKGSRKSNLVAQRQVESDQASAPAEAQQAAQVQQIAAVSVPEAQQSLMEDRAEGWAQEPAEARRAIEGLDVQLQAEAAKSARSLEEEREKAAALAQEVTAARNELTASTEQHRQTLAEERERSAALASEPATGQSQRRDPGGAIGQNCERSRRNSRPRYPWPSGNAAGARACRSASQRASKVAARGRSRSGGVEPKATMKPCSRSRRRRPPSRNCDNRCSRSKRRPPP